MSNLLFRYFVLLFIFFGYQSCKKVYEGTPGVNGTNGLNSLINVKQIAPGEGCSFGGFVIQSGLDQNSNNKLDSSEIIQTTSICNGSDVYDKQVILPVSNVFGVVTHVGDTTVYGGLIKFKKSNFINVDSIVFVAAPMVNNPTNTATIELYNTTDRTPVSGSALSANTIYTNQYNNRTTDYLQSGNLYNAIPDKEINLGVRLKTKIERESAVLVSSFLILYRK